MKDTLVDNIQHAIKHATLGMQFEEIQSILEDWYEAGLEIHLLVDGYEFQLVGGDAPELARFYDPQSLLGRMRLINAEQIAKHGEMGAPA